MNARHLIYYLVLVFIFPAWLTYSCTQESECKYHRELSAENYWYSEIYNGYGELKDHDNIRSGYYLDHPDLCFTIPLESIKNQQAKVLGYKRAIEQLRIDIALEMLSPRTSKLDKSSWNTSSKIRSMRSRIESLLGIEFATYDEFKKWWDENHDYLNWSQKKQQLYLDTEAKENEKPIASLNPVVDITGEEYWFQDGKNWLNNLEEKDEFIYGNAWNRGVGQYNIRVKIIEIEDKSNKLKGWRRAVDDTIQLYMQSDNLDGQTLDQTLNNLFKITGIDNRNMEFWIEWWTTNKANIRLSEDGTRLVTK